MVKKYIIGLVCILSLASCSVFFHTPFPEELIFWKDSVSVEGIGPFRYTRLYTLDDYVFLYVDEIDNEGKLYIFTKDLEQIADTRPSWCYTFAMKDALGYYIIGKHRYNLVDDELVDGPGELGFNGGDPTIMPPKGFGFSHAGYNYIVWWEETENRVEYRRYDAYWTLQPAGQDIHHVANMEDYNHLEALYYHEDQDNIDNSMVILFFTMNGDDVAVASVPASDFYNGALDVATISGNSFTIKGIDPKEYYYTGDGVVIYEHNNRYSRYNMKGEREKVYSADNHGYSEAYRLNGKKRYIFSETYQNLMKTKVWW